MVRLRRSTAVFPCLLGREQPPFVIIFRHQAARQPAEKAGLGTGVVQVDSPVDIANRRLEVAAVRAVESPPCVGPGQER